MFRGLSRAPTAPVPARPRLSAAPLLLPFHPWFDSAARSWLNREVPKLGIRTDQNWAPRIPRWFSGSLSDSEIGLQIDPNRKESQSRWQHTGGKHSGAVLLAARWARCTPAHCPGSPTICNIPSQSRPNLAGPFPPRPSPITISADLPARGCIPPLTLGHDTTPRLRVACWMDAL